eukprot:scaffold1411_cov396-Prasinococcus_capsulatus_cf.AAC.17
MGRPLLRARFSSLRPKMCCGGWQPSWTGIPAMAVVTKADLSPPECVAQWVTEIEQRFPYLSAVVAVRADMRGSSTSAGTVKAGSRSRWAGAVS